MTAWYNEIDPKAASWLRELMKQGHIAQGVVDERSILEVRPSDLVGYDQCHFFAGIGVWSHALRTAGWPDDRPVWTGSCPCQPFSAAGKRGGVDDARHLWPEFFRLIAECRPVTVFGEQVASKDGLAWLDSVHADLEGAGYAVGAVDTCAAGFGAPHIRQRLYFVGSLAYHDRRRQLESIEREIHTARSKQTQFEGSGPSRLVANDDNEGSQGHGRLGGEQVQEGWEGKERYGSKSGPTRLMADAEVCGSGAFDRESGAGVRRQESVGGRSVPRIVALPPRQQELTPTAGGLYAESRERGPTNGFWSNAEWLPCRDGKSRPVEPGTFPLAHGAAARVGRLRLESYPDRPHEERIIYSPLIQKGKARVMRLRGYGNAIVAPQATEFIRAYKEVSS